MTSQRNAALIHKLRGSLMYLAYVFDMFFMGVYTTRHWQTSSRLGQELNVCTVHTLHKVEANKATIIDYSKAPKEVLSEQVVG